MNEYETVVVTQPNTTESDHTKISSKLSSLIERGSGRLFYAKDMGQKTLAYPIKKQTKAVYTCFDYAGAGDVVQDFERALRIDENVLRFLTVVKNTNVDIEARAAEIVAKVCLSGLDAVIHAARMIRLGEVDVVVAGGQESMTNAPHLLPKSREGVKYGALEMLDSMAHDGLTDSFEGIAMGESTEKHNARLGILPLYLLMRDLGLIDTPFSLILTYTASGMPMSVFLLSVFFRNLPRELEDAARIDGAGEQGIFWRIMLPLVRPGLATVVIVNVVPWWNDFFFPLLFLPSKTWRTIPLGMQIFFGQHLIDWSLVFSGMLLASLPLLVIYLLMSRQFIAGLTAGAVKG